MTLLEKRGKKYHHIMVVQLKVYSCTTIKLRLYNYRVYSRTTKQVITVQLKGL